VPWKRQLLTGRLINGFNAIYRVPIYDARVGLFVISMNGVVAVMYDEARTIGHMCSVLRSGFVRLSPTVSCITDDGEVGRYVEILTSAVRDVYHAEVDVLE
jgi:hypothetical protein